MKGEGDVSRLEGEVWVEEVGVDAGDCSGLDGESAGGMMVGVRGIRSR